MHAYARVRGLGGWREKRPRRSPRDLLAQSPRKIKRCYSKQDKIYYNFFVL